MVKEPKKEKIYCQYCGAEAGNKGINAMHEKRCPKNPANIYQGAKETPIKDPPKEDGADDLLPIQVKITNVQDIVDDGLRAWFAGEDGSKIFRIPLKCGTVAIFDPNTQTSEEVLSVLVLTANGTLMPPSLVTGFLGMLPQDAQFSDLPTPAPQTEQLTPEPTIQERLAEVSQSKPVMENATQVVQEKKDMRDMSTQELLEKVRRG